MTLIRILQVLPVAGLILFSACNTKSDKSSTTEKDQPKMLIKEESVSYTADSTTMNGFVAYNDATKERRPVVLIVHEWWGLTDYPKSRARELAQMGYLAMAVDMYGSGKTAADPQEATKLSSPFYTNPVMAKARFDAALAKIKMNPLADTNNIVAIGYCFGGAQVLNVARMGENLKGVVSFHGNLAGVPVKKELLKAGILVCHGEADQFVKAEEVAKFKKEMDSIGAPYTFRSYPGATHAFTNPDATEKGKKFNLPIAYNAAADSASWNDMKVFFGQILK